MKRIVYVMAVMMMLALCNNSFAQVNKKEFNVENAGKTYQLQKGELVVTINNVGMNDIVAIEPTYVATSIKSKPFTIKAWEIKYNQDNTSNTNATKLSRVESINRLENISFQKGLLNVDVASSSDSSRSVIHMSLPRGVNTKVYVNGEQVHSGSLSGDGLMLQNGKNVSSAIIKDKGYSSEAALIQALMPVGRKPLTSYKTIDWKTLASLTTKSVPTPVGFSERGENWAMLQVDIDETGRVKNIFYAAGNESLASMSKQYLSQYEFKPFLVNEQPTKVKCLIPMTVVNGQIKFFSEGAK